MSLNDCEREGREAFRAARRRYECPYIGGPKRAHWLKGYDLEAKALV